MMCTVLKWLVITPNARSLLLFGWGLVFLQGHKEAATRFVPLVPPN